MTEKLNPGVYQVEFKVVLEGWFDRNWVKVVESESIEEAEEEVFSLIIREYPGLDPIISWVSTEYCAELPTLSPS